MWLEYWCGWVVLVGYFCCFLGIGVWNRRDCEGWNVGWSCYGGSWWVRLLLFIGLFKVVFSKFMSSGNRIVLGDYW